MVLNGGVANGHRIVPADWLAQATVSAVVVKLSYFPPGDDKPYGESLAFLAAASAWTPK